MAHRTCRTLTAMAGCVFCLTCTAQADFNWFNRTSNRITYASGGTNYLYGDTQSNSAGCFAQLIYAGTNNQIDPAVATGNGTSGDDEVCTNAWMGRGLFSSPHGRLEGGDFSGGVVGGLYYVRAWSAPSPEYAMGLIPSFPTNKYGDSILKQNQAFGIPDEFNFGGTTGFSTVTRARIVDSNTNGLPDWWEYRYFNTFTNVD
ncbi:MAG: hypothetical protein V2A34_16240, partial [Lentisphaerota bacterium]